LRFEPSARETARKKNASADFPLHNQKFQIKNFDAYRSSPYAETTPGWVQQLFI
jgi:hypothetical protein